VQRLEPRDPPTKRISADENRLDKSVAEKSDHQKTIHWRCRGQRPSPLNPRDDAVIWHQVACPLCGADSPAPSVIDRLQYGQEWLAFHIGRCRGCGLYYVTERATASGLGNEQGGAARRDAAQANRPIYAAGISALASEGLSEGARILDVGCARGDFLAFASERGFAVAGVDINPALAAHARDRGFEVHTGDLRDLTLSPAPDAITMWDVIEHVDDPVGVLSACAAAVRPGGWVLFHTGNARFQIPKARILSRLAPHGGPYLIPQQHLTHWDPSTAEKGLAQAGLTPSRVFFAGTLHYRQEWKRAAMGVLNGLGSVPPKMGLGLYSSSMAVIGRRG
jgi:2-polyprenyl-3-methyl-5-hydroxy-6-metoxy-1,4-benzoquinol methylase